MTQISKMVEIGVANFETHLQINFERLKQNMIMIENGRISGRKMIERGF